MVANEVAHMNPRARIAEMYLRMIPAAQGHRHEGLWVRLAAQYGVPFGRIVNLSGLAPELISAHLEGRG